MNWKLGTSIVAMIVGLAGCAADANQSAKAVEEHQYVHVMKHGSNGAAHKTYEIKIITDNSDEPIILKTHDPESPEFKKQLAELEKQGIKVDVDFDFDHEMHLVKLEELEGTLKELEGTHRIHIQKLRDLENLQVVEIEEALKSLEEVDHVKIVERLREVEGELVELDKLGKIRIDGKSIEELSEDGIWTSEDGTLHVIKKVGEDVTVIHSTDKDGEKHKKVHIEKAGKGEKAAKVEKKVIIIETKDGKEPLEEEFGEEDLK